MSHGTHCRETLLRWICLKVLSLCLMRYRLADGAARFGLYVRESYERYILIITAQGNTSILYHWDGKYPIASFV